MDDDSDFDDEYDLENFSPRHSSILTTTINLSKEQKDETCLSLLEKCQSSSSTQSSFSLSSTQSSPLNGISTRQFYSNSTRKPLSQNFANISNNKTRSIGQPISSTPISTKTVPSRGSSRKRSHYQDQEDDSGIAQKLIRLSFSSEVLEKVFINKY